MKPFIPKKYKLSISKKNITIFEYIQFYFNFFFANAPDSSLYFQIKRYKIT